MAERKRTEVVKLDAAKLLKKPVVTSIKSRPVFHFTSTECIKIGEKNEMTIEDWRRAIDVIDSQLVVILNERARLATKLGVMKRAAGAPINDSQRESNILKNVCQLNAGPFADEALKKIFRCIITETRRVEKEQTKHSSDASATIVRRNLRG